MASVNVTVNIDPMLMVKRAKRADHILAQQVAKDTERFVPALTGSISNRTEVRNDKIIYPGPYARYLYGGKLMVDPETGSSYAKKGNVKVLTSKSLVFNRAMHADAQAEWLEASKTVNLDSWLRAYGKALKE